MVSAEMKYFAALAADAHVWSFPNNGLTTPQQFAAQMYDIVNSEPRRYIGPFNQFWPAVCDGVRFGGAAIAEGEL